VRLCPACQHHTHLNKSGQRQTQGIGGQMPWEGEHNSNALGQGWAFSVEVTELQVQTITLAIQSSGPRGQYDISGNLEVLYLDLLGLLQISLLRLHHILMDHLELAVGHPRPTNGQNP